MHDDHQLIIDAPYSIVRHPSYLGYVLMILGMSLVWTQWYTFLSWIAVPGYVLVSRKEEKLLLERFGEQYQRYMDEVGGFIPRL